MKSFSFGVLLFLVFLIPTLIENNGLFITDGDYPFQSIPFTYHIRDSVLSGNIIWNHASGFGGQFLSNYAYYNLCSPFTLIYLILPRNWIVYAMPYMEAIKYGVGTMLATHYINRYVRSDMYSIVGGLTYMFSSFSAYNLVFHFSDAIALFPLLLITIDELCMNNRRCVFALSCALLAYTNYYFFFGQAVFLVIYFFTRYLSKDRKYFLKKLLDVALEATAGIMLAAPLLIPVFITLLDSAKATATINIADMFFYNGVNYYLKIIQGAFMIPDQFGCISYFPAVESSYPFGTVIGSVASYIPFFSIAGVLSYIYVRRGSRFSALLTICGIMALIPIGNQLFSGLNTSFYARWYYMPILIASLVSVKALQDGISFKYGIGVCALFIAAIAIRLNYGYSADEIKSYVSETMGITFNNTSAILNQIYLLITIFGLLSLMLVTALRKKKIFNVVFGAVFLVNILASYGITYYTAVTVGPEKDIYEKNMAIEEYSDDFASTDRVLFTANETSNLSLRYGLSSIDYFNSLTDAGFQRFLTENGLVENTGVNTPIDEESLPVCDIASVKYFYTSPKDEENSVYLSPVYEYEIVGKFGRMDIRENPNYVPMGLTYDYMISYEDFSKLENKEDKWKAYMSYLVVDNPDNFTDVLDLYKGDISTEDYENAVAERRQSCAYYTEYTKDGLVAYIDVGTPELVFFSVSYNDSWKVYVDGKEQQVYEVNNGLIGVKVPEGDHEIRLVYTVKGFAVGCIASFIGVAVLIVIKAVCGNKKER